MSPASSVSSPRPGRLNHACPACDDVELSPSSAVRRVRRLPAPAEPAKILDHGPDSEQRRHRVQQFGRPRHPTFDILDPRGHRVASPGHPCDGRTGPHKVANTPRRFSWQCTIGITTAAKWSLAWAKSQAQPGHRKGLCDPRGAGAKTGHLDAKTRELIALAVAISLRCDGCITVHAAEAKKHGASEEELAEALGVAVSVNAGAALVYSTRAHEAFKAA